MPTRAAAPNLDMAMTGTIHAAMGEATHGQGYAVSTLAVMGDGPGFRKVRRALGVTAFGINAIVLPAGYATGVHYHERQEETYFVHAGTVEFRFGDGSTHTLGPGGLARVDPATHRGMRNVGDGEAVVLVAGGQDGYVGRDGKPAGDDDPRGGLPGAA
jgi:mannose-6-phosphate isomerase-like protein (cupin superfamily)